MSTAQRKASTASPSSPGGGAFGPGRPRALTPVAVNGPAGGVGGRASSLSSAGTPAATTPRALHAKPSAALKPACDNPFAKPSAGATPFSAAYSGGHVPARIQHSAVHHTLAWSRPPADLPFDPLLLLCCEGLREVVHPHTFVARTALEELLASPGAGAKAQPLLPRLVAPLRAALASPSDACVLAALAALGQLARACGPALAPAVVRDVAVPVGRALERHPKPAVRDAARAALQAVDDCCGPAGAAALRAKLPTWGQR